MLLLLASCQREEIMPESTTAAAEVYRHYAGRKDLTVALIGDYHGYNAVMLQATTTEEWLWLCEELGVGKHVDIGMLDTAKLSSMTVTALKLDSASLPASIGEFVTNLLDSITSNNVGNINIDSLYTIARHQHWSNGVLEDESCDTTEGIVLPMLDDRLLRLATQHGNQGYLIHDDSDALTLWLFFYSTKEELAQIINAITTAH